MKIDLHCHSYYSDGTLAPSELLNRARTQKIKLLAITDHDTVDCYEDINPGLNTDINIITGIEFSSSWRKLGIHIVGLHLDIHNSNFLSGVHYQKQARKLRADKIIYRLNKKFGFSLSLDEIEQSSACHSIGRPHIAKALCKKNLAKNYKHAFKLYLGAGKIGDVKENWAQLEQIIAWIKSAGGTAILAHPLKYKLTRSKLIELLTEFKTLGGEGIEVCSGIQNPGRTDMLGRLAQDLEFYASCGSDFHSPEKSGSELGQFSPLPAYCQPVWQHWL